MATGDEQSKQDASAADAAVAQEKYDAQKTGDPIGDADLRATLGVPTTPQEQRQLDDQRFEMAFSPNIVARERFEESSPDGAPSAQHAADFAKYTADVQKANIDRDPAAFVAARQAEGQPATPDDIAKFENPTPADVLGASRQSQLVGVEIPVDSALATQVTAVLGGMSPGHVAPTNTLADDATGPSPERVDALAKFQEDLDKATVDRDPDAFTRARAFVGLTTTPADLAKFENPSTTEVLTTSRNAQLLQGLDIPEGSALAQQVANVLGGVGAGGVAPTDTMGSSHAGPSAGSGSGAPSSNTGSANVPVDRSDFSPIDTGQSGSSTSAPANDIPSGSGAAPAAAVPTDTAAPPATPATPESGSTPEPDDIPTSRGSAPTTVGLSMPGGVGTSSGGSTATVILDDEGMTTVGGQSTDTDGGVTTDLPGGGTGTTYPDGTSVYRDSDGRVTGTGTGANYEATRKGSDESASNDNSSTTTTTTDSTNTTDTDTTDSTDTTNTDDSQEATAMTNPDAATTPSGFAAGLAEPTKMDSGFGSSTHGGATDSGRADLDTGLGSITGEPVQTLTAGPDVDPDNQSTLSDRVADPFHSASGIGATDGIRPDLVDATGGGQIGPPINDGINPYATGTGEGSDRAGMSSADTAADGPTDPASDSSGISLVGSSSGTHGIQTVAGDSSTADAAPAAADATRGSESFAATGGDDDDLEELQVQRYVDPDAAGGTSSIAPTDDQLTHVITSHGDATDVVMGFGPAQIEGGASPLQSVDLVGNPSDPVGSVDVSTITVTPPGQDISHTINPDIGFGGDGSPSLAPRPSAADDSMLYGSSSSAATAATTTSADPGAVDKAGADGTASGGAEQARTEETSAPPAGGADSKFDTADQASGAAEQARADETGTDGQLTVVDTIAPVVELQPVQLEPVEVQPVDDVALPSDPVADATINPDPAPFEAPPESFVDLQVDDTLAVPAQVDLDDGF